jgi:ABC-2 type transport system ATP-binding protein
LLKVLKILNDNTIEIEDLSAVPTNLEEIFLKMMRDNASTS